MQVFRKKNDFFYSFGVPDKRKRSALNGDSGNLNTSKTKYTNSARWGELLARLV
jgi:hypothetical protein